MNENYYQHSKNFLFLLKLYSGTNNFFNIKIFAIFAKVLDGLF
jgi:hypothetical protein